MTYFSALLIGPPGSGKTTAASTAPFPNLYIDFDNKLHKMVNLQGKLARKQIIQYPIDEPLSLIGLRRLATDKQEQAGVRAQQQPRGYLRFVELIETLEKNDCTYNGVRIASLTLDSYTGMQEHLKRLILAANQKMSMTMPLYGVFLTNLEEVNNVLLRLKCNVLMLCHEKPDKDELTGRIKYYPLIEGQMSGKIGKDFEEVYFMQKTIQPNGTAKYEMMTVGDAMHDCRTSRTLSPVIEPDFCKMYNIKEAK